jgi:hypothetical protein
MASLLLIPKPTKGKILMPIFFEKWLAEIQITKISSSVLSQELNLNFVSGIMDGNQRNTLKEKMSNLSEC